MDSKEIARTYYESLKIVIEELNYSDLEEIANVLLDAYRNNQTVFIMGNGGSASTASHMACDFSKGTLKNVYDIKEKRFKVISLTDNVATMTAISNDLSYEDVFSQQLHNLIRKGDIVIGISGSGNSISIIKALELAKREGAITVGFLGYRDGGKAKKLCDLSIVVKSHNYGLIEDFHSSLGHVLTVMLARMKHDHDASLMTSQEFQ